VYVHYIKKKLKLQVVLKQNRKNAKGDEYFCKALYVIIVLNGQKFGSVKGKLLYLARGHQKFQTKQHLQFL
jgi:hypothetical protein